MGGVKRLISWVIGNSKYIVWKNKMYLSLFEDSIPDHYPQPPSRPLQLPPLPPPPTNWPSSQHPLHRDLSLNLLRYYNVDPDLVFCPDLNFPPPPRQQAPSQPFPKSPSWSPLLPHLLAYLNALFNPRRGQEKGWITQELRHLTLFTY